jgi:DNA-binding NtrC family response regulator
VGGTETLRVDARAVEHLLAYPWPGNVRQLENAIERMILFAGGSMLRLEDVPEEILHWRQEEEVRELEVRDFKEARSSFERRFLCAALHRHRGVIAQVAESVGLSRKSLYMKLENLEIDYERYRSRS